MAASQREQFSVSEKPIAPGAREEGFDEIADWFETLAKAERSHANRYTKALNELAD